MLLCGSGVITCPHLKPLGISYHFSGYHDFHCLCWQQTSCALLHPDIPLCLISSSDLHWPYCQQLISMFVGLHGLLYKFNCLHSGTISKLDIFFCRAPHLPVFPFVLTLASDVCILYIVVFSIQKDARSSIILT